MVLFIFPTLSTIYLFLSNLRYNSFLWETFFWENEPQKVQNLQNMLRKSPASNDWAAICKSARTL